MKFNECSSYFRESRRPTALKEHASYMDQQKMRSQKVITWDEANNARPPLRIDMDTPGPTSYTPRNKPLKEDNSPEWSFGRRTFVEKGEKELGKTKHVDHKKEFEKMYL